METGQPKIVFVGAGVIGGSVSGWVSEKNKNVYVLDQGPVKKALSEKGVTLYEQGRKEKAATVRMNVIDSLADVDSPDVVVIGVKNFHLDAVAKSVKDAVGDEPVIIGMQNGLANQEILPKYFSKVVYCVVSYNAWMDEPGVIGYQKKGPLHLGTLDGSLKSEMDAIARVWNRGVETEVTSRIQDAIHCKLVINLTNSVTTLLGLGFREIPDRALFQKLLTGTVWEGVEIVKKAGIRESKLGGMPPWLQLWAGSHIPRMISGPLFEKNVRKMVVSSMAQDVIQRKAGATELESINGAIVKIADKVGHPAPMNRAIYELSKREFAKGDKFEPLDAAEVWSFVEDFK